MNVVPLPVEPACEGCARRDEELRIQGELHLFERFHAFDAIKNDACPCCGGRVRVKETTNAVRLEAIDGNFGRLRDGVVQALEHLRQNRKTLAIDALKAALTGETW